MKIVHLSLLVATCAPLWIYAYTPVVCYIWTHTMWFWSYGRNLFLQSPLYAKNFRCYRICEMTQELCVASSAYRSCMSLRACEVMFQITPWFTVIGNIVGLLSFIIPPKYPMRNSGPSAKHNRTSKLENKLEIMHQSWGITTINIALW